MMYTESLITVYPHKTHKGLYVIIMERTYNPDGLRRYLQSNNLGSAHDKGVATVGKIPGKYFKRFGAKYTNGIPLSQKKKLNLLMKMGMRSYCDNEVSA